MHSCITTKIVIDLNLNQSLMKNIVLVLTIYLVACMSIACKSEGETTVEDIDTDNLNTYVSSIQDSDFNGTLLVAHKGDILVNKGFGKSNIEADIDNTSSTIFDIGSITKQFTGAAILKLEMQQKLKITDTISNYFSNVPNDKSDITIHHLLTHSAGLPPAIGDDYEELSDEEFVKRAFDQELLHDVGEKYEYSNVGYSLLALIIERVSNMTYEAYLNRHLFKPAGMDNTGYVLPKWNEKNIAVGYIKNRSWGKPNEKKWRSDGPYLNLKGNGGILSTTGDLFKWHKALLGDVILDPAAKKKYYSPHIKEYDDGDSFYGYGWVIIPTRRNTNLITHNGGNGIFFADFWRYLEEEITVIVLTNRASRQAEDLAMNAALSIIDPDHEVVPITEEDNNEVNIKQLCNEAFLTIKNGNEDELRSFINNNCSPEFIDMMPLEEHLSFLGKMKKRLQSGIIQSGDIKEEEVVLRIKTDTEEFNMILGIFQNEKDTFKIEGIMLD